MHRFLFLIISLTLILGCAKSNDPVQPTTNGGDSGILKIEKRFEAEGSALDMDITSGHLYIAEDEGGYSIWDKQTAELKVRVNAKRSEDSSQVNTYYDTKLISAVEECNFLFLYDKGPSSVRVVDITDKSNPQSKFNATGETASVACLDFGTNPGHSTMEYPVEDYPSYGFWINNSGNQATLLAYFAKGSSGGIESYFTRELSVGNVNNFIVEGDATNPIFYLAAGQLGVRVVTVTGNTEDGFEHQELVAIDTEGEALDILKHDNLLYVTTRQSGIQIVDITDLDNPILLTEKTFKLSSGYAQSVAMNETKNRLAVAYGGSGVCVFDISNKTELKLIDKLSKSEAGYCYKVMYDGDDLYVASRDMGVIKVGEATTSN